MERVSVLLELLVEVLKFAFEHAAHHVAFEVVDIAALEFLHHSLDLSVGDKPDVGVFVLHRAHRLIDLFVRVRRTR